MDLRNITIPEGWQIQVLPAQAGKFIDENAVSLFKWVVIQGLNGSYPVLQRAVTIVKIGQHKIYVVPEEHRMAVAAGLKAITDFPRFDSKSKAIPVAIAMAML